MRAILPLIYVIIGAVVAQQNDYLTPLKTFSQVVSAVLAIGLWPLVLLDVSLNVSLS
ncbi:MAG: hypothetical protein H0T43_01935 [Solirubrobacterales bacterium]|nr:hypothetical protein [Solirubrobacterales bacterium]